LPRPGFNVLLAGKAGVGRVSFDNSCLNLTNLPFFVSEVTLKRLSNEVRDATFFDGGKRLEPRGKGRRYARGQRHSIAQDLPPAADVHIVLTTCGVGIDKLSYPPAIRRVLPHTEHRRHKRLNNRAENSHRPVRKRERAMQPFSSPEQAQRFLQTFSAVCNHFRPRRHRLSAARYRQIMRERFQQWREIACLAPTA
jgi:hypothetical protein